MSLFGPPDVEKLKAKRDIKGLINGLGYRGYDDAYVRDSARKALVSIGLPAVESLIAALHHESCLRRSHAASALGEIGDRGAVEALISALNDTDWDVCHHATVSLGLLRDARAVGALITVLLSTEERVPQEPWGKPGNRESIFTCARQALVSIGAPAVEALVTALRHHHPTVRAGAAWALVDIADPRATEPLITAIRDSDDVVRANVAYGLGKLGDARATEPLIAALRDPNDGVRANAASSLGKLGDARATEPLVAPLRDPIDVVRANAAYSLGKLSDVRAGEALVRAMTDKDWPVRKNVRWALDKIGVDARTQQDVLVSILRDSDVHERLLIAETLDELSWQPDNGETGAVYWVTKQQWGKCVQIGPPAVEALIAELDVQRNIDIAQTRETLADVRAVHVDIIKALAEIGDARAVPALSNVILREREPFEEIFQQIQNLDHQACDAAVKALGKLGAPAVEALAITLQNNTFPQDVHITAVSSLSQIGDAQAVEALTSVLEQYKDDTSIFLMLIKTLSQLGDRRACAPILEILFRSGMREGYRWQDSTQFLCKIFGNYTAIISDLIGYTIRYEFYKVDNNLAKDNTEDEFPQDRFAGVSHISEDHDWFRSTGVRNPIEICVVEKNQKAMDRLCSIKTPVSNNLLHHVSNFQNIAMDRVCKPSFNQLGEKAMEELVRRGNPPYDPFVYLDDTAWKQQVQLCPQCGSPNAENAVRCHKCGHRFE